MWQDSNLELYASQTRADRKFRRSLERRAQTHVPAIFLAWRIFAARCGRARVIVWRIIYMPQYKALRLRVVLQRLFAVAIRVLRRWVRLAIRSRWGFEPVAPMEWFP